MIRRMEPRDLGEVGQVWLAASIQAHDFVAEEFWRADLPTMVGEILPHPRTEAYVFESDGRIDGFVSLGGDRVGCLFVRPGRQGRGIGAALLRHVQARRARLELTVYRRNVRATRFYEREGFRIRKEGTCPHTGFAEWTMEWSRADRATLHDDPRARGQPTDMETRTPPRLYCIPATRAPVVAVFRRGPSDWAHVGRWDLSADRYEPGAWLRGRIFPRRSDLSPDGRYLCCFAHKPGADWEHGEAYVAVSKLPWLTALHAFGTCGTWSRGYHFTEDGGSEDPEDAALPIPYGLRSIPVVQFATERRRGWEEAPDSPPRAADDAWDVRRNARLRKRRPGGDHVLHVESVGVAGGEFGAEQAVDGMRVRYRLERDGRFEPLDDLQWADWDGDGRLLAATRDGKLQVRDPDAPAPGVVGEHDPSAARPDPAPAPGWARRW